MHTLKIPKLKPFKVNTLSLFLFSPSLLSFTFFFLSSILSTKENGRNERRHENRNNLLNYNFIFNYMGRRIQSDYLL